MKYKKNRIALWSAFILIHWVFFIISCSQKIKRVSTTPSYKVENVVPQLAPSFVDTFCIHMRMQDSLQIVTLNEQLTEVVMQLNAAGYQSEMLKRKVDSLRAYVALGNFKMNRLKYYINIVVRNNSQIKFLKGWSNRVDSITIKDLPK